MIELVTRWSDVSEDGNSCITGWVFYVGNGNVLEVVEEIRDTMRHYTEPDGWTATYPGESFGHPIDIQWHENQSYAIVTQASGLDV